MRYLTAKYWKKFIDKDTGKKDGVKFEQLIGRILHLEYNIVWNKTQSTWDGSKDFYFYTDDKKIWAECKNYKKNISLNVLAPTLIMAYIDDIEEILIFSYSPLKAPVYKKIFRFADYSNKLIKVFDDESLEMLILNHQELIPEFFPEFILDYEKISICNPLITCSIIKDPLVAYNIESENNLIKISPNAVDFNTIICIYVNIHNRNNDNLHCSIVCFWNNNDHLYFDCLFESGKEYLIDIDEYSVKSLKLYLKITNYKARLKLPNINIKYYYGSIKDKYEIKKYEFPEVKCNWIGETMLIGSSYKTIIKEFNSYCINRNLVSVLHLFGTSGTGKSRLLNESINEGLKYGYKIIKFNAEDGDSRLNNRSKYLIKEFIYNIFDIINIDEEINYHDLKKYANGNRILEILQDINNIKEDTQCVDIDSYAEIIAERLCLSKRIIVLDNVQYLPEMFLLFIRKIFFLSINRNRPCKYIFLFAFNTDFLADNSIAMNMHQTIIQQCNNSSIRSYHVTGFNDENETRLFFNQLIKNNSNISEIYVSKFIQKVGVNPYYIKSVLTWMNTNEILSCDNEYYIINKTNDFITEIKKLPQDISEVIEKKWIFLLRNTTYDKIDFLFILSLIHFLGYIDTFIIEEYSINIALINVLEKYNFIKKDMFFCGRLIFHHDIIEQFFSKKYFPFSRIAITTISDNDNWPTLSHKIYFDITNALHLKKLITTPEIFASLDDIPARWRSEYIETITELIRKNLVDIYMPNYIYNAMGLAYRTREYEGTALSLKVFDIIYQSIFNDSKLMLDIAYGWFVITYCNLLYEYGFVGKALLYIKNYLNNFNQYSASIKKRRIEGYLYNRLYVYTRYNIENPAKAMVLKEYLDRSMQIAKKSNDDELKYINYSEYGYSQYCMASSNIYVLKQWNKACEIYETGNIPNKTLNYLLIKTRVALIQHSLQTAKNICDEALCYIETGPYAYHQTYFKIRMKLCLAIASLMSNNVNIEPIISDVIILNANMHLHVDWMIYMIQGISFFYDNEALKSLISLEQAYKYVYNSKKLTYKQALLEQIRENYKYVMYHSAILKLCIPMSNIYELDKIKNIISNSNQSLIQNYISNHYAHGILTSLDKKINFPCI